MKLWKNSLITALAFFGISTVMVYTACDRDSCLTLKCKNQAACVNGFCQCPTGYEGTECELWSTRRFVGTYTGHMTCSDTNLPEFDTTRIDVENGPNVIAVYVHSRANRKYVGTIESNSAQANDAQLVNSVQLKDSLNNSVGHLLLDSKKITIHLEDTVNAQFKSCTFVGNRP